MSNNSCVRINKRTNRECKKVSWKVSKPIQRKAG